MYTYNIIFIVLTLALRIDGLFLLVMMIITIYYIIRPESACSMITRSLGRNVHENIRTKTEKKYNDMQSNDVSDIDFVCVR